MASILVTGTNRGIGLATCLTLGRAGHHVFATVRDPKKASALEDVVAAESLPVEIAIMDVNLDKSVRETVGQIVADHGPLDVLVNNAGIYRRGSIEEQHLSKFKATMETNYFGAIRCTKAVLPGMRARGTGCIVNVTSVAGQIACSPMGPYTAAKFALESLSEVLAQEVKAYGIRVSIVEPGIIDTDMARAVATDSHRSLYPHTYRLAGLFTASLESPTGPGAVAQKIREIIETDTWQLRHPVGPDATPFLEWRAAMTDEEWVDWGASDDETWYAAVMRDFGLDARVGVEVNGHR
jgi:NAD(P)-dependent dehydrogenase (short-subunit alcohol dehydrogenase family)